MSFFTPKRLFEWHGWLGITFGALLTIICFSGSVAVLSHEIDWLLDPALRVTPTGPHTSWESWRTAASRAYPDWRIRWISAPPYSWAAADVVAETPSGQLHHIYVNPYTSIVQGSTTYFNVQRFLRDFHRMLNLGATGLLIVSGLGFVLLTSSLSGLLFYRNWWRQLFQLRLHKGTRALLSDLHRLIGVWTLIFALLIAITGIWYFVEISVFVARGTDTEPTTTLPVTHLLAAGSQPAIANLDSHIAAAVAAFPRLHVRSIWFPIATNEPLRIDGQATAWLVRDRANQVLLNPYTSEVISVQHAESLSALARWQDTADPLHFGNFAGLTVKLLWALLGLSIPALVITGAIFTLRQGYPASFQLWPLNYGSALSFAAFVLFLFAAHACYNATIRYRPAPIQSWSAAIPLTLGPYDFALRHSGKQLGLHLACASCEPNFASLALSGSAPMRRRSHDFIAPLPSRLPFTIELKDWRGTIHRAVVTQLPPAPPAVPPQTTASFVPLGVGFVVTVILAICIAFMYWWYRHVLLRTSASQTTRRQRSATPAPTSTLH